MGNQGVGKAQRFAPGLALVFIFLPFFAYADASQSWALPPSIEAPRDVVYPGQIALHVDATDLDHHLFSVHETLPVPKPGELVLHLPKWVPGAHSPAAQAGDLAGLVIHAGGQRVEWQRDLVDIYAFHVSVPAGVAALEIEFQHLTVPDASMGRVTMTPAIIDLQWQGLVLYPAGYFARGISVGASVVFPAGWQFGSALEVATIDHATTQFRPVSLDRLIDSPVFAGRYFKRVDLDPGSRATVHLDIVGDRPEDVELSADELARHRNLVQQAYRTFWSHHYDHYDFLFALSDELGGIGLEHHRSSENAVGRSYFTDWNRLEARRDLLAHEYTHSWNGKFRRPADLWAPDFNVPERNSLLWVYEGQTQYWGQVLAARSGLFARQEALDSIAFTAAAVQAMSGRDWRSLQDTTNQPVIGGAAPQAWHDWSRSVDYYPEGVMLWLDVDTLIRERTNGARSLNDYARAFLGVGNGGFDELTYQFDDVVAALNQVFPYDWAGFLRARLDGHASGGPQDGLARGGYRLVFTDTPSPFSRSYDRLHLITDFSYSLGIALGKQGVLDGVAWNGPAFKAGLAKGATIVAVNGLAFDGPDDVGDAISLAAKDKAPLELLVREGRHFRSVRIDYRGGLRYPHLERIAGAPDRLGDILAPVK